MMYPHHIVVYNVSEQYPSYDDWFNRIWFRYPEGWVPIFYVTFVCMILTNLFSLVTLAKERFRSNVLFAYLISMTLVDLSYLSTSMGDFAIRGSFREDKICDEENKNITKAATMTLTLLDIFGTSTDLVVCCLTLNRFVKVKSIKEKKKPEDCFRLAFALSFVMVMLNSVIHIPQFFGFKYEYLNISEARPMKCWIALSSE